MVRRLPRWRLALPVAAAFVVLVALAHGQPAPTIAGPYRDAELIGGQWVGPDTGPCSSHCRAIIDAAWSQVGMYTPTGTYTKVEFHSRPRVAADGTPLLYGGTSFYVVFVLPDHTKRAVAMSCIGNPACGEGSPPTYSGSHSDPDGSPGPRKGPATIPGRP